MAEFETVPSRYRRHPWADLFEYSGCDRFDPRLRQRCRTAAIGARLGPVGFDEGSDNRTHGCVAGHAPGDDRQPSFEGGETHVANPTDGTLGVGQPDPIDTPKEIHRQCPEKGFHFTPGKRVGRMGFDPVDGEPHSGDLFLTQASSRTSPIAAVLINTEMSRAESAEGAATWFTGDLAALKP